MAEKIGDGHLVLMDFILDVRRRQRVLDKRVSSRFLFIDHDSQVRRGNSLGQRANGKNRLVVWKQSLLDIAVAVAGEVHLGALVHGTE